jgi:hypothetical protein
MWWGWKVGVVEVFGCGVVVVGRGGRLWQGWCGPVETGPLWKVVVMAVAVVFPFPLTLHIC